MGNKNARKPIGRSVDLDVVSISPEETIYTLSTGRKIRFFETYIAADKVETQTYPHKQNKRIADDLTRASLELMIDSISRQQYQPVIAQKIDGKYAAMDGSRRRQAAIFAGRGLKVLFCEEELTKAEVKALAKELQSAKEHSIRENGREFALLVEENPELNQVEIAGLAGFSQGYVSVALKAWEIPQALIDLYEHPGDITKPEFKVLEKVMKHINSVGMSVAELIELTEIKPETSNDEVTNFIAEASGLTKLKVPADKPTKFVEISSKKWAKSKRVNDKTTITLNRATDEEYKQIEAYITKVMGGEVKT